MIRCLSASIVCGTVMMLLGGAGDVLAQPRPRDTRDTTGRAGAAAARDSHPKSATLPAVSVAAARPTVPEFEARRAQRIGHFLTREELQKQDYRRLSDILARVPGIRVIRGGGGHAWVTTARGASSGRLRGDAMRGARTGCYSDVYVDNTAMYYTPSSLPLFDISTISPSAIEAIEFYSGPAQIPGEFSKTNASCGVLVIWTRRGK